MNGSAAAHFRKTLPCWLLLVWAVCSSMTGLTNGLAKPVARKAATAHKKVVRKVTKKVVVTRTVRKTMIKPVAHPAKDAVVTSVNAAMFGPRYAHVAVKDQQLRGAVYYLTAGHGGPDPGAIGTYGKYALAEDEYAYDVTIRLARALTEHGAQVYMILRDPNDGIRDGAVLPIDHDEVIYPNQRVALSQLTRLRQCTDAINGLYKKHGGQTYQRMVTIHVDSRSEGQMIDVFFYHHQRSKVAKQTARHIHRSFKAGYRRSQPTRSYSGTVSERNELYVVRNSLAPTVFIELGNIRNSKDQRRFLVADNRQALANWICTGLQKDYRR